MKGAGPNDKIMYNNGSNNRNMKVVQIKLQNATKHHIV